MLKTGVFHFPFFFLAFCFFPTWQTKWKMSRQRVAQVRLQNGVLIRRKACKNGGGVEEVLIGCRVFLLNSWVFDLC